MSLLMEALRVADDRKQQTELSQYLGTLQTEEKSPIPAKQSTLSTGDESHTLEWETTSFQQSEQSIVPSEVEQRKRSLSEELEPTDYFKGEFATEKEVSQPEFATVDLNLDDDLLKEYQQLQQTSDHQDANHDQNSTHSVEEPISPVSKLNELSSKPLSMFEPEISSIEQEVTVFEPESLSVEQTATVRSELSSIERTLDLAEQTLEWLDWLDWDEELRPSYSDSELNRVLATSTEKGEVPFTFSDSKNSQPPAQRILEAGGKPAASKRVKWLYALATLTLIGVVGTIGGFYYKNLCSNQFLLEKKEPICDTERLKNALLHPFQNKVEPNPIESAIAKTVSEPIVFAEVSTESTKKNVAPSQQIVPKQSEPVAVVKSPIQETMVKKEAELPREPVKPRETVKPVIIPSQESEVQEPKVKESKMKVPTVKSPVVTKKESVVKETLVTVTPKVEKEPSSAPMTFLQKDTTHQKNKKIAEAYQAFQQKRDSVAQNLYKEVLYQDTKNRDALLGLAAIAARNGQAEQARSYYQQVLQFYPQDTLAQMGLNSVQLTQVPELKESQLKSMVERLPDASDLHFDLGNFYASQQQWSAAQQAYFEAYRLDKKQADYAYNLAISLDRLNQPRLALNYYQEALQLSKNQSATTYHFDPQAIQRRIQTLITYTRNPTITD